MTAAQALTKYVRYKNDYVRIISCALYTVCRTAVDDMGKWWCCLSNEVVVLPNGAAVQSCLCAHS